jgi:hypothetical protein
VALTISYIFAAQYEIQTNYSSPFSLRGFGGDGL